MNLIITACIKVNKDVPYVTITDEKRRYDEYCETIRWAIEETRFNNIVFCDNSNYDFDSKVYLDLAKKYGKSFEYLTFTGNSAEIIKKGKGYGEGEIMNYVLENSQSLKKENYFYKITGRLKINNINSIIKDNRKNYFMNKYLTNQVDTRFYGVCKKDFIDFLSHAHENVNDLKGYFLEHAYFDSLNKVKYRNFYRRPFFCGFSGSTGSIYNDQPKKNEFIISLLFRLNIYNNRIFYKLKMLVKKALKKA